MSDDQADPIDSETPRAADALRALRVASRGGANVFVVGARDGLNLGEAVETVLSGASNYLDTCTTVLSESVPGQCLPDPSIDRYFVMRTMVYCLKQVRENSVRDGEDQSPLSADLVSICVALARTDEESVNAHVESLVEYADSRQVTEAALRELSSCQNLVPGDSDEYPATAKLGGTGWYWAGTLLALVHQHGGAAALQRAVEHLRGTHLSVQNLNVESLRAAKAVEQEDQGITWGIRRTIEMQLRNCVENGIAGPSLEGVVRGMSVMGALPGRGNYWDSPMRTLVDRFPHEVVECCARCLPHTDRGKETMLALMALCMREAGAKGVTSLGREGHRHVRRLAAPANRQTETGLYALALLAATGDRSALDDLRQAIVRDNDLVERAAELYRDHFLEDDPIEIAGARLEDCEDLRRAPHELVIVYQCSGLLGWIGEDSLDFVLMDASEWMLEEWPGQFRALGLNDVARSFETAIRACDPMWTKLSVSERRDRMEGLSDAQRDVIQTTEDRIVDASEWIYARINVYAVEHREVFTPE